MSGRGAERVLDALEWLADRPGPSSLAEFAQALDTPKSSALLLLRLFVDRGYAARDADGRYALSRLPGERSAGKPAWGTLLRVATPFMAAAVNEAQETGCLAVLDGDRVRYLNKILPKREVRYDRDISRMRSPQQVASGIVLLSALEDDDLREVSTTLGLEADAVRDLMDDVAATRVDGHFTNMKGLVEGAAGVAVPIYDSAGRMVAAFNLSGPKERVATSADRLIEVATKTARAVSEELARRGGTRNGSSGEKIA